MDLLERPTATTAPTLTAQEISSTTAPTERSGVHRVAVFREFEQAMKRLAEELAEEGEAPIAPSVKRPAWDIYLQASECASPSCSIDLFYGGEGGLAVSCQNAECSRRLKFSISPQRPGTVKIARIALDSTSYGDTSISYLNLPGEMEWLESSAAAMVPATY